MPLFMILSLLTSSTVIGFTFNFNFNNLVSKDSQESVLSQVAYAADMASTTVTVRNAAPTFTIQPAENPVSTSSSPVNVGYNIDFVATANDIEDNNYYLIVCATDSVSPGEDGAAPSCGGDEFCVSGAVASDGEASCTYAVVDSGSETDDWYAFVCDDHSTEADCSGSSQGAAPGTGDSSSPFYINHAPVFSLVLTTDDDKDPGQTYTITASVLDGDVADEPDELHLYVCNSNSWATSTGCADLEYCHATSTSADVSCDTFATTTPAKDGTYGYYAFVKDWHEMPATGNSQVSTYSVNNVAPTVGSVILNSGDNIILNFKDEDEYIASTTSVSISDNNGCSDISSGGAYATSSIYWSSATSSENCVADDDDCYQIGSASCVLDVSSCTGYDDPTVTYTCTTTLAFHAIPTDDSTNNPNSGTNWLAGISIFDDDGARGVGTTSLGVEIETLTSLEITETEIPYGTIKGGQDSGAYNATTTVVNAGNSPLDSEIEGTDMNRSGGGGVIRESNQEFGLSNFVYGFGTYTLSSTTPDVVDITAPKPQTSQIDVSDQIFWGIGIPGGTLSGDYSGMNTFTAALDESNW